ncbi:MAG TPA: hypothetical protein VJT74_06475 [Pyrinomonadaceae bacterium]|nr:hypothetical protein [Pyrinomonadaceae bacterium]
MRASVILRRVWPAAARFVIACLIISACWAAMFYAGLPVPAPAEVLDKFKGVSRLADILS